MRAQSMTAYNDRGLRAAGQRAGSFEIRAYRLRTERRREFRRKLLVFLMTLFLILICAVSYHSLSTSAHSGEEQVYFKYYTNISVEYGETLWTIAEEYIDYGGYRDIGEYISEVQSINHLSEDCALKSGQNLIIPYFSSEFK